MPFRMRVRVTVQDCTRVGNIVFCTVIEIGLRYRLRLWLGIKLQLRVRVGVMAPCGPRPMVRIKEL